MTDKNFLKLEIIFDYGGEYRGPTNRICKLKYSVTKKIPIVIHNGSNYDYHFIIKELQEEFKKQFTLFRENTEKYITFTIPIEKKVTRIDKNGEESTKNISYILQVIDNARFMAHFEILSIIFLK